MSGKDSPTMSSGNPSQHNITSNPSNSNPPYDSPMMNGGMSYHWNLDSNDFMFLDFPSNTSNTNGNADTKENNLHLQAQDNISISNQSGADVSSFKNENHSSSNLSSLENTVNQYNIHNKLPVAGPVENQYVPQPYQPTNQNKTDSRASSNLATIQPYPTPTSQNISGLNYQSQQPQFNNFNHPVPSHNHPTANQLSTPQSYQSHLSNMSQSSQAQSQPRSKTRPCDHCRRRKTKCVIVPETNNCVQCASKGLKCTYQDNSMKRTIPLTHEDSKRAKFDPLQPPDVPIRETQPVHDYSTMPGNSLLKRTLSLQFPRSSFYVGPTSIFDINLLNKIKLDKIDQVQLSPTLSLRKVGPNVQFTLRDDYTEDLYEKSEKDSDAVEKFVAPHGQILIDLYFRVVHPSFPILHKKVFLEKYSRTHREFSSPLLAAVYSLAIQWWDYDPQLSQHPKPNVEALNALALKTFSEIIQRPKLSAVQAGLLLLQCRPDDSTNWVLCSQVVALAEELGLGLDCQTWRLPKWERGLRRRLAWAVFVQDKWLSLINSRPSHIIIGKNWVVENVTEDDFPEKHGDGDLKEGSSDIENGKLLFKNMISLSEIVGDILDTFFSMSAIGSVTRIDQTLKLAKPLQLRLRQWYHSLPVELQMVSMQPRKLCSNGYLQLAYFAAELTLHRKIITTLTPDSPKELVHVCRTAARTRLLASIDFVRDLKPEHIHSFWHSSATANFALIGTFAAILFVTSITPQEAAMYRDQVFNYRWILRVSAKGFDQAAAALDKIDSVLNHIPGLLVDEGSKMITPNVPVVNYSQQNQNQNQSQNHLQISQGQQPINQVYNSNPKQRSGGINMNGVQYSSSNNDNNSPTNMPSWSANTPASVHSPSSQHSPLSQPSYLVKPIHSPSQLSPKEIIKQQQSVKIHQGNRQPSNSSRPGSRVNSPNSLRMEPPNKHINYNNNNNNNNYNGNSNKNGHSRQKSTDSIGSSKNDNGNNDRMNSIDAASGASPLMGSNDGNNRAT